jgi:hypothetical protein
MGKAREVSAKQIDIPGFGHGGRRRRVLGEFDLQMPP